MCNFSYFYQNGFIMGLHFTRILTIDQGKVIFRLKIIYLQILEGFGMVLALYLVQKLSHVSY